MNYRRADDRSEHHTCSRVVKVFIDIHSMRRESIDFVGLNISRVGVG